MDSGRLPAWLEVTPIFREGPKRRRTPILYAVYVLRRKSGVRSQETEVRSSGVRRQKSGVRSQETEVRSQEAEGRSKE